MPPGPGSSKILRHEKTGEDGSVATSTPRHEPLPQQAGSCGGRRSLEQLVERRPRLLVAEQVIGALQLLELVGGLGVVGVLIWMLHKRQLAVGLGQEGAGKRASR